MKASARFLLDICGIAGAMIPVPHIRPISPADEEMNSLSKEAAGEKFSFVERLIREWADGTNRFNGSGEILLGAFVGDQLVGVGGLNQEPYDPAPGRTRLRHLYVLPAFRRGGMARALVSELLQIARSNFYEVRLRTASPDAALFYMRMGFQPTSLPTATHFRVLGGSTHNP